MKKTVKILRCILLIAFLTFITLYSYGTVKLHWNAAKSGTEYEIAVAPDKKTVIEGAYLNFEMPCVVEGKFDKQGGGYLTFRKGKDGLAVYAPVVPVQTLKEPGLRVRSRLALWDMEIEPPFKRWYLGKVLSKDEAKKLTAAAEKGKLTIRFRVLYGTGCITGAYLNGKPVENFLK